MSTTYAKGKYQAKVLQQGFEESAAKGTPYFFLQLLILAIYDANGELKECPQYERTYRQYLNTETGVNIFKGDLRTLGVQVSDFSQLDPASPNHVSLVGTVITAGCDVEHYQGKPVERWGILRSGKKLILDAIRALNDQFGHLLDGGNGSANPSPAIVKPNDSDVPF
jgi:hypothetical protein